MKKIILPSVFALVALISSFHAAAQADTTRNIMPGSDRDAHGCIGSAGYTWSQLKKTCIRVFESGTPLLATPEAPNQTLAAYLVWGKGTSKAELFIPEKSMGSVIFIKSAKQKNTWKSGDWTLQKKGKWELMNKQTVLYRQP